MKVKHSAGIPPYPTGYKIIKINNDGDTLKAIFYNDNTNEPNRLLVSKDGNFYFNSSDNPLIPNDLYTGGLNKLNPEMDSIMWSVVLPNNQLTDGRIYDVEDIIEAKNGDIIICGRVWDRSDSPPSEPQNVHSTYNGFIMRLTPDGSINWLKLYKNPQTLLNQNIYGLHRHSTLKKIQELDNGNFVAGGEIYYTIYQRSQINPEEQEISHLWLISTDSMGCIEGYPCNEIVRLYKTATNKLVNPKVSWTEKDYIDGITYNSRYKFSEDSTFFLLHYYKELMSSNEESGDNFIGLNRYFREENNRIYEYNQNKEILMYDFNLNLKDTFYVENPMFQFTEPIIANQILDSTLLLNGDHRRTIAMYCMDIDPTLTTWIEGIGSTSGFLSVYYSCAFDINTSLQCFYINDTLVYLNPESSECWTTSTKEINYQNFSIIPNPSSEKIVIKGDLEFDAINIYTSSGVQIIKKTSDRILNITDLPTGHYIIELVNKGKSLGKQKFIKI